jgi:exoribonuclease R
VVRTLGKIGDKDTENEVLLLEHDVPHSKFSENVLACLPKVPWSISAEVSYFSFVQSINHFFRTHLILPVAVVNLQRAIALTA